MWIGDRFGMVALAVVMTLIPILGYAIAKPIAEVPPEPGEPHPFPHLLERVIRMALRLRRRR